MAGSVQTTGAEERATARATPPSGSVSSAQPGRASSDPAAVKFLRTLQVLLKSTRLYDAEHPQVQENVANAEQALRAAQAAAGSPALAIRVEEGRLISAASGRPLLDPRGDLKSLAEDLSRRGITSLQFTLETHLGELFNFAALLAGKPPHLGPKRGKRGHSPQKGPGGAPRAQLPAEGAYAGDWAELLEGYRIFGIRVNALTEERRADAATTGLVVMVLQEAAATAETDGPARSGHEVIQAVHLLSRIGGALKADASKSASQTVLDLRAAVGSTDSRSAKIVGGTISGHAPADQETLDSYLERLTEEVVLEFARDEFQAGRAPARELRSLLTGFAFSLLGAAPSRAQGARPAPLGSRWTEESWTEHLLERFWLETHASEKSEVLHSRDAWCIPVAAVRRYVEPAIGGSEASKREARAVLLDYSRCVIADEVAPRLATASGLMEMTDLIEQLWPAELPDNLRNGILWALVEERTPEVAGVLSAIAVRLAETVFARQQYGDLDEILDTLTNGSPRAAQQGHLTLLAQRLLQGPRWDALVNAALKPRHLDANLVQILARDPERLLDTLGARLSQGDLRELAAMARLVRAAGEPAVGALVTRLFDPRNQRASTAVKLLAATHAERLLEALPRALPSWDWQLQDMAVSELVSAGGKKCASVFLAALPHAHPLVVPMMLDQIGLAREAAAVPLLVAIAAGRDERLKEVFVRIKAIEALGRIGPASGAEAADVLRSILRERRGLTHTEPAGLRAAAEEALGLIENWPSSARVRTAREALEKSGVTHAQPRRYLRIPLESPLAARIESPTAGPARVRSISLGGAFLESNRRLNVGDALQVEIRAGLRRIHGKAVVRNVTPLGSGVEFVHMTQDDREKLRRLVSKLMRG